MGKPAARIGDMHTCPQTNPGPVPHVGGPIAVGAPTVIVAGMPAARVGDMAVCVGPPDTIASGSSGVIIAGKPAARLGDSTAHGGKIVVGAPTVLIGDGGGGGGGGGSSVGAGGSAKRVAPGTDLGLGGLEAPLAQAQALVEAAREASPTCEICSK